MAPANRVLWPTIPLCCCNRVAMPKLLSKCVVFPDVGTESAKWAQVHGIPRGRKGNLIPIGEKIASTRQTRSRYVQQDFAKHRGQGRDARLFSCPVDLMREEGDLVLLGNPEDVEFAMGSRPPKPVPIVG